MKKEYSLFVGRWQPWHNGHQWLIDQRLNLGKNVLICIRDMPTDEKNPFTPAEVLANLNERFAADIESERIKVIIIPNIESINYGRSVGYEVIEHTPPAAVAEISATKERAKLREEGKIR